MQTRELYIQLFAKKVNTPEEFLDEIINPSHPFYSATREYVAEILSRDTSWQWLASQIDDFGLEVEQIVAKKVQRWKFRAILGTGKMPMCDTKSTIKWLFNRMINEYKNIFDERSQNYLDIRKSDNELKVHAIKKMEEYNE